MVGPWTRPSRRVWAWAQKHPDLTVIGLYFLIGRFAWWPLLNFLDSLLSDEEAVRIILENIPTALKAIAWTFWGLLLFIALMVAAIWLVIKLFSLLGNLA